MTAYREPESPFLELSFYFADRTESDALASVVSTFLDRGSHFYAASALVRVGGRDERFGREVAAQHDEISSISELAEFKQALVDPDVKILSVSLEDALGTAAAREQIVYLPLRSDEAVAEDQHPIVLCADGQLWDFDSDEPDVDQKEKRAWWAGLQAYRVLRSIVESTKPSYAAVAIERTVESPADLRHFASEANGFSDFFVSDDFLGSSAIEKIRVLFADAFLEQWAGGLYTSCLPEFNPVRIRARGVLIERMSEVAALVGDAGSAALAPQRLSGLS